MRQWPRAHSGLSHPGTLHTVRVIQTVYTNVLTDVLTVCNDSYMNTTYCTGCLDIDTDHEDNYSSCCNEPVTTTPEDYR